MSANAIIFDATTGEWNLNGQIALDRNHVFNDNNLAWGKEHGALRVVTCMRDADLAPLTDRSLGELVGFATGAGITTLEFNTCTLAVEYISKMLSFKARYGSFVDFVDDTADHNFDRNNPTPGGRWSEVKNLLDLAAKAEEQGRASEALFRDDLAAQARSDAQELYRQAHELLVPSGD